MLWLISSDKGVDQERWRSSCLSEGSLEHPQRAERQQVGTCLPGPARQQAGTYSPKLTSDCYCRAQAGLLMVGGADGSVRVWRDYTFRGTQRLATAWQVRPFTPHVSSTLRVAHSRRTEGCAIVPSVSRQDAHLTSIVTTGQVMCDPIQGSPLPQKDSCLSLPLK